MASPSIDTKTPTAPLDIPESGALSARPELVREALNTPPRTPQAQASADSAFGQLSYRHSDLFGKLGMALAQAQGEFQSIDKALTASVQSKREGARSYVYHYADLAAVLAAVRPALAKYGLAVVQVPTVRRGAVVVTTMLMHGESEQWFAGDLAVALENLDPQAVGSATTYARRYGLTALLGVAAGEQDDDGKAAREPRTVAPEKPEGYDNTWADLEIAAEGGVKALDSAWNECGVAFKNFTVQHNKTAQKALQQKAQKAGR